jgi:hypothetical protein
VGWIFLPSTSIILTYSLVNSQIILTHLLLNTQSGRLTHRSGHALGESEALCLLIAVSFLKRRRPWFISLSDKALTKVPSPAGVVGRLLKLQARVQHE